jgi:hypothetical protein
VKYSTLQGHRSTAQLFKIAITSKPLQKIKAVHSPKEFIITIHSEITKKDAERCTAGIRNVQWRAVTPEVVGVVE